MAPSDRRPHRDAFDVRGHERGFRIVALVFFGTMAFTTLPTPIYAFYAKMDGFPTWVTTVIFAAYAVGVIGALFLVGHLSDVWGRTRMISIGLAAELVSIVVFLAASSVAGLLIARFVSGAGVGTLMAAAGAALLELDGIARPGEGTARAATTNTVANTGGLALGPLLAGLMVTYLPGPTIVPYAVFAVLLVAGLLALTRVPETVVVPASRPPYRPQRVSLPRSSRGAFLTAALAAFAGFGVFGVFTALAPAILQEVFGITAPVIGGLVAFSVFAASAVAQLAFAPLTMRRQLVLAIVLMVVGLASLAVGTLTGTLWLFAASGVVGGAGVGLVFRAAMATAARVADPAHRGEVMAGMLLAAYLGLVIPVLSVGVSLALWPMPPVLAVFAGVFAALVLAACVPMARR